MAGAPAQMDLLDYKPQTKKLFNTDLPDEIRQGQRLNRLPAWIKTPAIVPTTRFLQLKNASLRIGFELLHFL